MKIRKLFCVLLALLMMGGSALAEGFSFDTLGEAMALETEESLSNYNDQHFIYGFIVDGAPIRVTAEMSGEIYDAILDLEYDDDYEQNFRDLVAGQPVIKVEDLTEEALSQEELDAFAGQTGEDLLDYGFEMNGYTYSDEDTMFYLEYGPFEYIAEFEEIIEDEDADAYDLMPGMTVKSVTRGGLSFSSVNDPDYEYDGGEFDLFSLFGMDLYSSVPRPVESPEWVANLPAAQEAEQLFVVAGMGMDQTTATVSLHMKDEDGAWIQVLSTPGFVGKNGLCPDEDHAEGCGQTPIGVYRFNKAFGIAEDPGCSMEYIQVDENTYWSGDENEHYNQMVDITDYPGLDLTNSEHIVDYDYQYRYCLNISFNEEGEAGRGSAIFLHCFGPAKPFTGGCVAIPENIMKQVVQYVSEDCVVVIDTLENLGGGF